MIELTTVTGYVLINSNGHYYKPICNGQYECTDFCAIGGIVPECIFKNLEQAKEARDKLRILGLTANLIKIALERIEEE